MSATATPCALDGCASSVSSPGHLLCADHWKRVPTGIRRDYYRRKWHADHGRDQTGEQLEQARQAVLEAAGQ